MRDTLFPHDKLIRKLESFDALDAEGAAALRTLPLKLVSLDPGADAFQDGSKPSECCLLVQGMLARYKLVDGGAARQIISFHFPGDIPDLQSLHLRTLDHGGVAITPCTVAYIAHKVIRDLLKATPHLTDVFWRETLIDAAIFREWTTNNGRRPAYQRVGHLLCEIYFRMRAIDLTQGWSCAFPLTQAELGDATGLSVVHVNRTLQALRRDGLIELAGGRLTIIDWDRLAEASDFDPTYLHLREAASSGPRPLHRSA